MKHIMNLIVVLALSLSATFAKAQQYNDYSMLSHFSVHYKPGSGAENTTIAQLAKMSDDIYMTVSEVGYKNGQSCITTLYSVFTNPQFGTSITYDVKCVAVDAKANVNVNLSKLIEEAVQKKLGIDFKREGCVEEYGCQRTGGATVHN